MPAASSIYWDSVDSQRSSESSGDVGTSRNYIDPWDLENYAYLRRHSIVSAPPVQSHPPRSSNSRISHRQNQADYWESVREPGYHAPASVEEVYFGSKSNQPSYYQPIYDDRYAAPVYAPLSELDHRKLGGKRRNERQRRASQVYVEREECIHKVSSNRHSFAEVYPREEFYVDVKPLSNIGLNNYGHLKIDYSNSWNSLQRKITK